MPTKVNGDMYMVTFKCPVSLFEELYDVSRQLGENVSEVIRRSIKWYLMFAKRAMEAGCDPRRIA